MRGRTASSSEKLSAASCRHVCGLLALPLPAALQPSLHYFAAFASKFACCQAFPASKCVPTSTLSPLGALLNGAGWSSVCAGAVLSVVLVVYLWGSCIAYLIIIGDSFSPLLSLAAGARLQTDVAVNQPALPVCAGHYNDRRPAP